MNAQLRIINSAHAGLIAGKEYPIVDVYCGGYVIDDDGVKIWVSPREGKVVSGVDPFTQQEAATL